MVTRCEVLRMAGELCVQLAGESVPADFEAAGEYSQTIAAVRQRYTNYQVLLDAVPDCPLECPIAAAAGLETGAACFNYHLARDILQTEARRRALVMFAACEPWAVGAG